MSTNIWEPYTVVESMSGFQAVSLRAKELSEGIIHISGEINDEMADSVISQIKYLISEGKDICIMINTRGGSWPAGLAIVDAVRMYKDRITTICTSCAYSVGAVILSAALPGNRYIFPHANVIIGYPKISAKISGTEEAIEGYIGGLRYIKNIYLDILSETTSMKDTEINKIIGDDCFLEPLEAIECGFCDKIIDDLCVITHK